jgi:hypothetical protein
LIGSDRFFHALHSHQFMPPARATFVAVRKR